MQHIDNDFLKFLDSICRGCTNKEFRETRLEGIMDAYATHGTLTERQVALIEKNAKFQYKEMPMLPFEPIHLPGRELPRARDFILEGNRDDETEDMLWSVIEAIHNIATEALKQRQ